MHKQPNRFLHAIAGHPAVFFSAFILLLAALVGVACRQGQQIALEHMERALDERVNTHKYYLLEALGKFWLAPEIIAAAPPVRQILAQATPKNIESANRLLNDIAANAQIDRIFVMAPDGTALAANGGPGLAPIIGNNYRLRPYFQQAIAGKTGHFIGIGIASRVLGFFISRPVVQDGKIAGVVAVRVSLSLEVFRSVLKQYWKDNSEVALLADEHGVIFMSPIDRWMYHTIAPLAQSERQQIKDSRQYADHPLLPLPMQTGEALTDTLRFVRFADIPHQVFLQKSYSIGEIGDRLYLHVNASRYWEPVFSYTVIAALMALAALLLAVAAYQRWSYRNSLVNAAIHDPLTGLYTRLYMNEWIQNALRAHLRDETAGFALVLFDLDNFKQVNDQYGHLAGDAVLKEAGKIIIGSVRAADMAVRYGGEELAIFVHYQDTSEVLALAERIRHKLEHSPVQSEAGRIAVTASAGVAYHLRGETSQALFARADQKLYEAKECGRNRICV